MEPSKPSDDQLLTRELVNSELTGRLARQDQSGVRIETKLTVLLGFSATAAQFLATQQHARGAALGVIAFAAYAVAFGCGLWGLRVSKYREVDALRLVDYESRPTIEVVRRLIAVRADAYRIGALRNRQKARFWWASVASLTLGLVLSVVALSVHNG